MLHIVNKSSFERNSLQSCINTIDDDSVILLIEDGVISATKNDNFALLADLAAQGRVYALSADVEARGITTKIDNNIKLAGYDGFVDLVEQHETSVSWV